MTTIEKLDFYLNYLRGPSNSICTPEATSYIREHMNEFNIYVEKLLKDGYAHRTPTVNNKNEIFVTIDGKLFLEQGGYLHQLRMQEANDSLILKKERDAVRNEKIVRWGTWFAAVVGALALLWTIFVWCYPSKDSFTTPKVTSSTTTKGNLTKEQKL